MCAMGIAMGLAMGVSSKPKSGPEPLIAPIRLSTQRGLYRAQENAVMVQPEPHGSTVCASGCSLNQNPTPRLAAKHFHELLAQYARQPMSEASPALEELLYYGSQTGDYLEQEGSRPLDPARAALLARELRRSQAIIEFRVVDEEGVVRVHLPPVHVPLDVRYVFKPLEVNDFPALEASGTVKRTGLHHLWQRI